MAAVPRSFFAPRPDARARPRPFLADDGVVAHIARLAEAAGVPAPRLMADLASLALGPGRIALSDFERLRLYDDGFWGEADRREVAGARRVRELARLANFRHDWFALADNLIASGAYLAAHGLPTVPILAIFRAGLASPGPQLLRSRAELRSFLEARAGQPLCARPAEGGAARLLFAKAEHDPAAEIERTLDEACDTPGVSWVFQPCVAPHPDLARLTGGRPAPVRLVTLAGGPEVKVFRALWRLGGPDDLVASLDLRTGRALALAPAADPHNCEPAPVGLQAPDWAAVKAVACEGARLFNAFGLLGWDVAPAAAGPVILGLDPAPDFALHQLADRRGLLEPQFLAFLDARRLMAAAAARDACDG